VGRADPGREEGVPVPGLAFAPLISLADQFLELAQLLLNDAGNLFDSAFCLKIGIVGQFSFGLFSGSFCVVKIALDLLLCAVCHFSSKRLVSRILSSTSTYESKRLDERPKPATMRLIPDKADSARCEAAPKENEENGFLPAAYRRSNLYQAANIKLLRERQGQVHGLIPSTWRE
jgi:hypothetical protein